ncbi:uncharacterized protein LOC128744628 isoform X2 [Sabethes cyaneus]|uniref:uncharacterized protein LOC128744628 isoform X2 n=1 Tax=Sabethes cyaneus TaxID=53552 RepID=UPI00237E091C|nr:uncharacterized protein LOC128744628 isoform X2 [Sabethes cyaneus]
MKPKLRYTYCTLLLVSLVSSGLLFIMVASEASKPVRQHRIAQEENLSNVDSQNRREAVTRHGPDAPPHHRLEDMVNNAHEQSAKIVSEFQEIVNGERDSPHGDNGTASESDAIVKRVRKKRSASSDRTARRMSSRKKDILVERPAAAEAAPDLKEVIFLETVSKNAGITTEGLQDLPGPPSVVTLVEHQNNEMQIESKLEENIEATLKNISHHVIEEAAEDHAQALFDEVPSRQDSTTDSIPVKIALEQAERLEEKIDDSGGTDDPPKIHPEESIGDVRNLTTESQQQQGLEVNLTEENPMPVFSEWAQKQMAEAEKKLGENVNASAMKRNSKPAGGKMPPLQLRAKNYAAPDCGAKIIASNAEAQSTGSVLTSHKDEYLLNPCTSKIWFVVELCEPIQAERVEMANFELFSSSPRDFSVSVSNRFPTRDWANVGQFTAKDERDVQSFNLHPHLFGKFVRVEIHSHYNSEHYCPVSLFRVYGTSEFEAFETDNAPSISDEEDDDDVELVISDGMHLGGGETTSDSENSEPEEIKPKKTENILKSAGEAVMNIVKKAAEALGKTNENSAANETHVENSQSSNTGLSNSMQQSRSSTYCFSLAYQPQCVSCSDELRRQLERTLTCNYYLLTSLLNVEQISVSFDESQHLLCANILGHPLGDEYDSQSLNFNRSFLSWFPPVYSVGICNIRAFDRGLIEPIKTVGDKSHSNKNFDDLKVEQPSFQGETIEQPPLEQVASGNEDSRVASSADEEEVTAKPSPQEDVNIFTLQEEAVTAEVPLVEDQQIVPELLPESPTLATTNPSAQTEKDADDTVSGSNGTQLDDIEGLLLDEHPLDGSGIPTITSTTSTTPSPELTSSVPAASQKGQPESVFLRLSNRIKALERNMSLSGQYLEELSRRYRKQVEELQNSYAKTLFEIEEQNHRIRDSEEALRQENSRLREEFTSFRDSLLNWKTLAIAVGSIVLTQLLVCWVVLRGCRRQNVTHPDRETIDRELAQISTSGKPIRGKLLRRKSIDTVMGGTQLGAVGSLKRKRPSEEALNITGTYENLLIEDNAKGDGLKSERKRSRHKNRKTSAPPGCVPPAGNLKTKRATSAEPPEARLPGKPDLVRTESAPEPRRPTPDMNKSEEHNRIDELPLLEDNDEFIIPNSDLSYNEFVPDSTSEQINKTNGMGSSTSSIDSKPTSKPAKGRRLSSPAFFKSSFLRASRKSSDSPFEEHRSLADANNLETSVTNSKTSINKSNSSGTEWYKLKKSSSQDSKLIKRKAKSESPEVVVETVGNGSINGEAAADSERKLKMSTSLNGSSEKKLSESRRSFRRLFRKVF